MALINQNSIIGVTSITSPSASNVLTVHTNDTTERLRVSTSGVSFSGTNASLDTSGNLTIAGVLTYEDVTSVDSVGLSTFQNGIHVTGGSVGIGSDNPTDVVDILTGDSDEVTSLKVKTQGRVELSRNHSSAPYIKTLMNSGNPNIILGDSGGDKVKINGDGVSYFNGGNVGIGTDNPQGKLDIWGNVVITDQDLGLYFSDPDNKSEYHQIYMSSSDNSLNLKTYSGSWGKRLTIETGGNIGIGTDNPSAILDVVSNDASAYIAEFRQAHASNTAQIIIDSPVDGASRPSYMDYATGGTVKWRTGLAYLDANRSFHIGTGSIPANSKLTIKPDGDVGIGTDNPEGQLHLNGTTRYVQTISAINGVTAGTTSGTIYRQQYTTDSTSRRMGFFGIKRSSGSGDQRAKFVMELCPDNSTNLGLGAPANNTTAFEFNHNGTILVKNGGGIDFSETSDSSGTMTSELLDDYEEGSFTAILRSHSTNTTTTGYDTSTNSNNATYTKVGRLVTINMEWNNLHNDARAHVLRHIDGLPFTSWQHNRSTAAIGYQRGLYFRYSGSAETTNNHHLYGAIEGNSTQVALNASKGSSPYSGWPTTHDAASSMYLRLSMQYYV